MPVSERPRASIPSMAPTAPMRTEPAPATAPRTPDPADVPRRRAGPARRLLEGVALLAVVAVALELTVRVEDWIRFRTPFASRLRSQSDLIVRDADGAHGRANARYQKWVMNALGTRGPEVALAKPAGTLRVATIGASETFGLYESPAREYPRQLEDSLNVGGAAAGPRYEVLNAALPGMSLPTTVQDVRLRLARYALDVVVLYASPAGYLDLEPPTLARPDSSGRAAELPLRYAFHPRAAQRLRTQLKTLVPDAVETWLRARETRATLAARPAGWRFDAPPADRLARFDAELRRAVGAIRAIGAEPVLATHANAFYGQARPDAMRLVQWEKFFPRASGPVLVAFDSLARETVLRVARDSAVVVADVAESLRGRPVDDDFVDFAHFTDGGAARVAHTLRPAVVDAAARARRR